jgi:DNA/RNA-binding domain of Phe-tRNA-synthetase-like protein
VTPATTRVLVVVFCPPERAETNLAPMLESVADRLARHCEGHAVALQVVQ